MIDDGVKIRSELVVHERSTLRGSAGSRFECVPGRELFGSSFRSAISGVVSANRLDVQEFTGTNGDPLPSTEVAIRAVDNDCVLPPGESGEPCVKGPQVMAGYWQRPDETAKVTTSDGFFRTGDIAVMQPDGSLKVVDRIKDMVLVSGFNVYPNEVEEVLAALGRAGGGGDRRARRALGRDGGRLHREEGRQPERGRPARLLQGPPDRLQDPAPGRLRDSLPKTPVGKVLRRELRDEVLGRSSSVIRALAFVRANSISTG